MMPSSLCACSHPDLEHPLQRSWRGIPHAFWPRMPYPHSALLEQRRSGSCLAWAETLRKLGEHYLLHRGAAFLL